MLASGPTRPSLSFLKVVTFLLLTLPVALGVRDRAMGRMHRWLAFASRSGRARTRAGLLTELEREREF